ncbi:polyunsaturated fatty acid lipoxygenase ALOX15B-like, partial [Oxyura jamaicensis]|uniref:polyunsaturated fatty acid lipoxygenase ALOX15B-like n=1 Tax=Oxyura jamaicensis TaxID=8884 RepID=UPI0015A5F8D9
SLAPPPPPPTPKLSQQPGPVFLPRDPPWLWALAKAWVRSAEFHVHEAVSHLLRAHLLGEVFALATRRQLAPRHPLYKLLLPHTRYTVHIAVLARRFLLNPGGVFDRAIALGRRGLLRVVARGLRRLRYGDLVLPRDLRRRGVTRTRGYHYGQDARRLWAAIRRWGAVPSWGRYGVPGGRYGVLGGRSGCCGCSEPHGCRRDRGRRGCCGCSEVLRVLQRLQFELGAFMPNLPAAMRRPPPRSKALLSEADFLGALPAVNTTCITLGVLWVLRNEPLDMRPLGSYPEEHFTEEAPRRLLGAFQRRLARISRRVQRRNAALPLPYPYLDPATIENSIAI